MVSATRISFVIAICLFGFVLSCQGQVKRRGFCPRVSVQPQFNASSYMGVWYETAKYPAVFETGGRCITANYTLLNNGTVGVVNAQLNAYLNTTLEIKGNAKVIDNAKLLVNFPGFSPSKEGSNYWVLGTDYKNYSVVFSCNKTGFWSHTEIVWILTRERNPSVQTLLDAFKVLSKNKLSFDDLKVTNQEGCRRR